MGKDRLILSLDTGDGFKPVAMISNKDFDSNNVIEFACKEDKEDYIVFTKQPNGCIHIAMFSNEEAHFVLKPLDIQQLAIYLLQE